MPSVLMMALGFALAIALGAGPASPDVRRVGSQARSRIVYASVTKDGKPVTDMTASEFEVREGGRKAEITRVQLAAAPLRIALIDADGGTGAFQLGILKFVEKLLGHAEFSFTSVLVQPEKVLDCSSDIGELNRAINSVGIRGQQRTNPQLIEAISEAAKSVRHEGMRPAIVVTRIGGEATSPLVGDNVKEDLRTSGAILYVVSTLSATAQTASQVQGTDPVSVARGQLADDEVKTSILNLAVVLGDGSRDSGGRNETVVSTTLVTTMEQMADELLNQYQIEYVLPAGAKPGDRVSVSSIRKGVVVHAPGRIPG